MASSHLRLRVLPFTSSLLRSANFRQPLLLGLPFLMLSLLGGLLLGKQLFRFL